MDNRDTILAYLAGIIDGEGCIYINTKKATATRRPGHTVVLTIVQKERGWLEMLQERTGFDGTMYTYNRASPVTAWRLTGKDAIEMLEAVLPYLTLKKNQAEGALELAKTISLKRKPHLTPEVVEYRNWVKQSISDFNQRAHRWDV